MDKKLKTGKGNNDIAQCNIRPVTMHYIVDCQMSGRGRNCYQFRKEKENCGLKWSGKIVGEAES